MWGTCHQEHSACQKSYLILQKLKWTLKYHSGKVTLKSRSRDRKWWMTRKAVRWFTLNLFILCFYQRFLCGVMCFLFSPGGKRWLLQWRNYASAYRSKHTEPISCGSTRVVDMEIRTHRSQRSPMAAYSLCGNSSGKCSLPTPGPGLHRADSIAGWVCTARVCVQDAELHCSQTMRAVSQVSSWPGRQRPRFFKVLGALF